MPGKWRYNELPHSLILVVPTSATPSFYLPHLQSQTARSKFYISKDQILTCRHLQGMRHEFHPHEVIWLANYCCYVQNLSNNVRAAVTAKHFMPILAVLRCSDLFYTIGPQFISLFKVRVASHISNWALASENTPSGWMKFLFYENHFASNIFAW